MEIKEGGGRWERGVEDNGGGIKWEEWGRKEKKEERKRERREEIK